MQLKSLNIISDILVVTIVDHIEKYLLLSLDFYDEGLNLSFSVSYRKIIL